MKPAFFPAEFGRSSRAALVALVAPLLAIAAAVAQDAPAGGQVPALLQQLEGGDAEQARAALAQLLVAGAPAAHAALEGLDARPLEARRARARLVREKGDSECLPQALTALGDADVEVRRELATFVAYRLRATPPETAERIAAGCAALSTRAREDSERELRLLAIESLARCDDARATAALRALIADLPAPDRALAARGLAAQPRSRDDVVALVQRGFSGAEALPVDVLTVLLADGYGADLAELPAGGTAPADRAPFALGFRHPDPALSAAAHLALERYLGRVRFLGDVERGQSLLAALCAQGLDDDDLLLRRATFALEAGRSARDALAPLALLVRRGSAVPSPEPEQRLAVATARLLEGAAHFALGESGPAHAALDSAAQWFDGLRGERPDLGNQGQHARAGELLELRGLVELYAVLALLQEGRSSTGDEVRTRAVRAHELSLEAQLVRARGPFRSATFKGDFDELLQDHALGPMTLFFTNLEQRDTPRERALALERGLCEALATAAPLEMPGFGAPRARGDVVDASALDERRWGLLREILKAELDQVDREMRRTERTAPEARMLANLMGALLQFDQEGRGGLLKLRVPSNLGLQLATDLREDGKPAEGRALAERFSADLAQTDLLFGQAYAELLIARAQAAIGSSFTDEGQPEQAEKVLLTALERIEAVERGLDAGPAGDTQSRALRSNVLISLAVNANVKLRDQEKAVAYFERAYELRQDDFTRTLLACYRARAGRSEEARAALRETPVSPYNYYNLACTYALLGEKDTAFEYLRRELDENHGSDGGRARQQTWARTDPDLASLHDDPRFEALLAPRTAGDRR